MATMSDSVEMHLPGRLLFHPRAFHVRRMRSAIWLYLALLALMPAASASVDADPADLGRVMGLPESTVRSWLGHLRKHRYVTTQSLGGSIRVRVKRLPRSTVPEAPPATRFFTVAKLEQALGETGHRDLLESALAANADPTIKQALANALAVPAIEIRRSRTALFLYLLKRERS